MPLRSLRALARLSQKARDTSEESDSIQDVFAAAVDARVVIREAGPFLSFCMWALSATYVVGSASDGIPMPACETVRLYLTVINASSSGDCVLTVRNISAATTATATLPESANFADAACALSFAAGDKLAVECTSVGTGTAGLNGHVHVQ